MLPAADLWREAAIAQQDADPGSLVVVLPEQILISAMPVRTADPALLRDLAGGALTASEVESDAGAAGAPGTTEAPESRGGPGGRGGRRIRKGRAVPGLRTGAAGGAGETGQPGGMAVRPPTGGGPTWEVLAHMETQSGLAPRSGPRAAPETRAGLDRRDTVVDEPA